MSQRLSAEAIPASGAKDEARRALEQHGFTVHDQGTSLTIEGEQETFERALGIGIEVNPRAAPGEAVATPRGEPHLPEDVRGLVEGVAFQKRAHMFGPPPDTGRERNG